MTMSKFKGLVAAAAVLGAVCYLLLSMDPDSTMLVLATPTYQIIMLLWEIAGMGEAWRLAVIILYVVICAIPLAGLGVIARRRKPYNEDWLLVLLSAVMFLLMYRALDDSDYINCVLLQMGVLTVLLTWLVLRVLRYFNGSDNARLVKLSKAVIVLLGLLFGFSLGWLAPSVVIQLLTAPSIALIADAVSVIAQNVIAIYGCCIALGLALALGPDGELTGEAVTEAERLYRYSAKALAAVMLISMAANLIKLVFIEFSPTNNVNVSLPLMPLFFCLAALIVSRFMAAHKQLRDDNDLFV